MDGPSAQLQADLRRAVRDALSSRRPLLHHLNDDSSWLIQLPRPDVAVRRGVRSYFNILVDPWLKGGQSDVASWFSQQFHATESAVQTIAELEEVIFEIELLAYNEYVGRNKAVDVEEALNREATLIDAVTISHEYVPVFAAVEAAKLINGWKHFRTVIPLSAFGANGNRDWRTFSVPPLPTWIGISRIMSPSDALYYHSAIMITWDSGHAIGTGPPRDDSTRKHSNHVLETEDDEDDAEAIIYTPHGVDSEDLKVVPNAVPPITTLAFLHGLHNVRLASWGRTALQLNLGVYNGLKAQRILKSKYWVGTHDEVKTGRGLVGFFIKRDVKSVQDALQEERERRQDNRPSEEYSEEDKVLLSFEDTNWLDVRNGESRVLT
ncbi:hypothetical protein CKM354_000579700 [Cercospora kikuchii]|uniref:Uncharacterized protein n=1 Tax=Cercospora kikuchii TaxID=84275 RepID=A0A9P3CE06_9PEZI|nr:uncharacterized protein CKM354_000579700 [Cercospora kikuchii]GIZ42534.1 hypothetical protein CKM354_000579700 [Cercospora kikuchii]